jgi:colanic acid biosynthesis glycosyl transferase WcaI
MATSRLRAQREQQMRKNKALFITQYYRPELVGSAPFCGDLAEWLRGAGWEITVLTGLPNYPDGKVFEPYRRGAGRRECINGVGVERLAVWVPKRRFALARIASEVWFLIQGWWAIASRRVRPHRLVVSLCPSILAVLLGSLARHPTGRHVAIVHDIQSGLAQGLNMIRASWLLRVMRWCERGIFNRVDLIVVLTDEMKEYLRQLGVVAAIEIVSIWADTERIQPVPDVEDESARLVYSGSFGRKQNLEQIVALAADIKHRAPEMEILLRGRGAEFEALRTQATAKGLRNIRFSDLVAADRLFADMSSADIHLVVHDPSAASFAIPSKIYNIMAAGLPCVAQAQPETALGRLQRESNGFLCVRAGDPQALAGAALRLAGDIALRRELGRNGRRYVERNCAKEIVLDRLLARAEGLSLRHSVSQAESTLIFEPEAEGHSDEWLRHLIRYAQARAENGIVWIVMAPGLYDNLAVALRRVAGDQVRLLPLTRREARLCCHQWLSVSSFARWWIARRYLSRTHARAVHFLSLDLLSLPLALGLPMKRRSVSGTLFRPSTHYRFLGPYDPDWRERLRDARKNILYRLMLSNRSLSTALTLDPYFARYAARFYRNGAKIRPVADPAKHPETVSCDVAPLAAKIPPHRVFFLLFGHLTERKGTLKLLDALQLIPSEIAARVVVMLAGKLDPAIRHVTRYKLSRLRDARPGLSCQLEDRWVENEEIEALMGRADVVLAPYQRFVGSSGVMLWAARFGKPLLTQDFGVLGSLAREHQLGMTVDCTNPFLLADAIAQLVAKGPENFIDRALAREFIAKHSPDDFAKAVLASLAA